MVRLNCGHSTWGWMAGTAGPRVGWNEEHEDYPKWLIRRSKKYFVPNSLTSHSTLGSFWVTRIIMFIPDVFTILYSVDIPFIYLVYFKHLSLNMKQKRSECERTLSTSQIGQNGSRLLTKKRKTSRFGLSPLGGLDTTKEQRSTQL